MGEGGKEEKSSKSTNGSDELGEAAKLRVWVFVVL